MFLPVTCPMRRLLSREVAQDWIKNMTAFVKSKQPVVAGDFIRVGVPRFWKLPLDFFRGWALIFMISMSMLTGVCIPG